MDKDLFIKACREIESEIIVQQHLIDGTSYFFDCIQIGEEFEFKKDLAKSLGVHIRNIVIVGSGKLGFSIKPDDDILSFYPFKDFDHDYIIDVENEKSDLDIAVVSGSLFDKQLVQIYNHTNCYSLSSYKGRTKKSFADYILKGWLRPDFVPIDYAITNEIKAVQDKYKMKYGRDINIGIYKSWYFFEKYHQNNIDKIKLNLITQL